MKAIKNSLLLIILIKFTISCEDVNSGFIENLIDPEKSDFKEFETDCSGKYAKFYIDTKTQRILKFQEAEYDPEGEETEADMMLREANYLERIHGNYDLMSLSEPHSCYIDMDNNDNIIKVAIIMDYFNLGSLTNYITKTNKVNQSAIYKWFIMKQIIYSMIKLHKFNILHLDMKMDNVLMRNDFTPVLSDYGLSFNKEEAEKGDLLTIRGTKGFIDPESITEVKSEKLTFTELSDTYSLGQTFYYFLNPLATKVYDEGNDEMLIKNEEEESEVYQVFKPIINDMLNVERSKRIILQQVLDQMNFLLPDVFKRLREENFSFRTFKNQLKKYLKKTKFEDQKKHFEIELQIMENYYTLFKKSEFRKQTSEMKSKVILMEENIKNKQNQIAKLFDQIKAQQKMESERKSYAQVNQIRNKSIDGFLSSNQNSSERSSSINSYRSNSNSSHKPPLILKARSGSIKPKLNNSQILNQQPTRTSLSAQNNYSPKYQIMKANSIVYADQPLKKSNVIRIQNNSKIFDDFQNLKINQLKNSYQEESQKGYQYQDNINQLQQQVNSLNKSILAHYYESNFNQNEQFKNNVNQEQISLRNKIGKVSDKSLI